MVQTSTGKQMAYTDITLTRDGSVLTITVDRPEVLNTQSRIVKEELDHASAFAERDIEVIIARAGTHFSAGHDLGNPQEMEDCEKHQYSPGTEGEYERSRRKNIANTLSWRDSSKPTIAQVQGY